jgi:hypothetical protein
MGGLQTGKRLRPIQAAYATKTTFAVDFIVIHGRRAGSEAGDKNGMARCYLRSGAAELICTH